MPRAVAESIARLDKRENKEFDMKKEHPELSKGKSAARRATGLSLQAAPSYDALVSAIEGLVLDARAGLKAAMNAIMLQTY